MAGCDLVEKRGTTMSEAIDLMKFHMTGTHGGEEEEEASPE